MAKTCMTASGTDSLIFIGDVMEDGSGRMNVQMYRQILSADIQRNSSNLISLCFILQQKHHKHTAYALSGFWSFGKLR